MNPLIILVLVSLFFGVPVFAQQTQFYKLERDANLNFFYTWDDHQKTRYSLQYQLPKRLAYRYFSDFRRYSPETAQQHIALILSGKTSDMRNDGMKLTINLQGATLSYSLSGGDKKKQQKWLKTLASLRHSAFNDYLTSIDHIEFKGFAGTPMVKPDHVKIATESRETFVPLAKAMRRHIPAYISKRKQIDFLLNFVQSIPYDPLVKRQHTVPLAFAPPATALIQNLGDCDSKATLFASLMRLFYPGGTVALIILPDHALIGLSLQPNDGDLSIDSEQGRLVLLEVAGPAVLPAGQVGDSTRKAIESGQYIIELLPPMAPLDIEPQS